MLAFPKMICLVGENPLPIYLGIKQFLNRGGADTEVILVHSSDTKDEAEAIRKTCGEHAGLGRKLFRLELLSNPFEPDMVLKSMRELRGRYPDAALNYTGGTKVMSGFGLVTWASVVENKNLLDRVFYLEERTGNFHFGNRTEGVRLSATLSLNEIADLHGVGQPLAEGGIGLTPQDLRQIFDSQSSYTLFSRNGAPSNENLDAQDQKDWDTFLGMLTPETRQRWAENFSRDYKHQYGCAAGKWYEQLIWRLVCSIRSDGTWLPFEANFQQAHMPLVPENEVFYNRCFFVERERFRKTLNFETDLLLVYKQRLRYFSVTTSRNPKTCKSKMFEAKYRSQQIGGGMASSCVVCLAEKKVKDVNGLEYDMATAFQMALGNDPRHIFFDRTEVREWMSGNTESLRKFLME